MAAAEHWNPTSALADEDSAARADTTRVQPRRDASELVVCLTTLASHIEERDAAIGVLRHSKVASCKIIDNVSGTIYLTISNPLPSSVSSFSSSSSSSIAPCRRRRRR